MIARATHASFMTVRLLTRNDQGEERGGVYEISYREVSVGRCQHAGVPVVQLRKKTSRLPPTSRVSLRATDLPPLPPDVRTAVDAVDIVATYLHVILLVMLLAQQVLKPSGPCGAALVGFLSTRARKPCSLFGKRRLGVRAMSSEPRKSCDPRAMAILDYWCAPFVSAAPLHSDKCMHALISNASTGLRLLESLLISADLHCNAISRSCGIQVRAAMEYPTVDATRC